MRRRDLIYTILNKISIAVLIIVVVLFSVDKSYLGFSYIGAIPLFCLMLVTIYIGKLERKTAINKKVKIISWISFIATIIIGLAIIFSFPDIFNTYDL